MKHKRQHDDRLRVTEQSGPFLPFSVSLVRNKSTAGDRHCLTHIYILISVVE